MIKQIICSLFALVFFQGALKAQALFPMLDKLEYTETSEKYKNESAIYVLDQQEIRYRIDKINNQTAVIRSIGHHFVTKLLDEKGVESFNKIHLPSADERVYNDLQAKVLTGDGKTITFGKDKITREKDENGNEAVFLALEGVGIGSMVEFRFEFENSISLIEGSVDFTNTFPVIRSDFAFQIPDGLTVEMKSYNGYAEVKDSLNENEKRIYYASDHDIKPIKEEKYGNSVDIEPHISYRLSYIPESSGNKRLNTYNDLAQELYQIYYTYDEKKDKKSIERFLKENGVTGHTDERDKIISIEELIKTNITINDALESGESLADLIKNRTGNSRSVTRLYCACFQVMDIDFNLGLTCNRYTHKLDPDFEMWAPLDYFIFKFNHYPGYIAPEDMTLRYPLVSLVVYESLGVFCKDRKLGGTTTVLADITQIKPQEHTKNNYVKKIDVHFSGDMIPRVDYVNEYYGMAAAYQRPYYYFSPEDKRKEILKELEGVTESLDEIQDFKIEHIEMTSIPREEPLRITLSLNQPDLVSRAGNTLLLKVGELIGPQAEMYKTEERAQPIDINFVHRLIRDITIQIPPGYKVANPDDVMINKIHDHYGFKTTYKLENGVMRIHLDEYYTKLQMPREEIEPFREVINAAADFNKVTLVLEKQ